jgi:hypothetical protein
METPLTLVALFFSVSQQFLHSKYMSWAYASSGLATPIDNILHVLRYIMHAEAADGQPAMDHLQCFLGYELTGHTSSQVRLREGHLLWFHSKTILLGSLTGFRNISESMLPAISSLHVITLPLALGTRRPRNGGSSVVPGGYELREGHLLWFHRKRILLESLLVAQFTMKSSHHSIVEPTGIGDPVRRGAGNGVLMALLRLLLGSFYKDINKDIIVSTRGQRAAAKGAAYPLEAVKVILWRS